MLKLSFLLKFQKMLQHFKFLKGATHLLKKILFWPTSPFVVQFLGNFFLKLEYTDMHNENIKLTQVKNVLVVRVDLIGDIVLTTPFFRELRRNLPDAWITLVVNQETKNIVEKCPYIDEVLCFNWKAPKYLAPYVRIWRTLKLSKHHLWKKHFDLAILPRWDTDSYHGTYLVYFSGTSRRLGYSETVNNNKRRFNRGYDRLLTHALDDREVKHEVERGLNLLRFIGGTVHDDRLELWLTEDDEVYANNLLRLFPVQAPNIIISIAPSASIPIRIWPVFNFIELGQWLVNEYHVRLLLIGGPGEEHLGEKIRNHLGESVIDIIGKTTLRQTAAVLKKCLLFIGNDSGPMHMAAALGVPVLEISSFPVNGDPLDVNSPARFGPWGVPHRIVQPEKPIPPCRDGCISQDAHCILGVTVEQVKEATTELLLNMNKSKMAKMSGQPFKLDFQREVNE